ncbi:MAG: transglutaminase-like cysteine peptidase [Paucibacter sp.]|nr:transglutaminase-like cysteine peptidase [Roseateles sp.]
MAFSQRSSFRLLRTLAFALALASACMGAPALDSARFLESAEKRGPHTVAEARAVLKLIERASTQDELVRLILVNDFFDQHIRYAEDIDVWGVLDYWASPLEALQKGAGDCEDYAIAKYFTLASAGVPIAKLRMVYVRAMVDGKSLAHMVLAYYAQPGAEPLILDNLITEVKPASQRPDLTPQFSFNSEGLWNGQGAPWGNPASRISQWRDVLMKVKDEGF